MLMVITLTLSVLRRYRQNRMLKDDKQTQYLADDRQIVIIKGLTPENGLTLSFTNVPFNTYEVVFGLT